MRKKKNISHLKDHIGYWLRIISNNVSYSFSQKLETNNVTVAEWVVLREMYDTDASTSSSTVADLTGLTRGAISKLIARLLEKGLVSRKESTDDRRYQDIKLTAKAIALLPQLAAFADQNDEKYFSVLTSKEKDQLIEILKKLADHHRLHSAPTE